MLVQVEFAFETEPNAYRFLNTVKHFDAKELVVKRGRSAQPMAVLMTLQQNSTILPGKWVARSVINGGFSFTGTE